MTRDTGDNVDFLNNRPRRGEGVRRLNRVPLLIAGLMLLMILGAVTYTYQMRLAEIRRKAAESGTRPGPANIETLFEGAPDGGLIPARQTPGPLGPEDKAAPVQESKPSLVAPVDPYADEWKRYAKEREQLTALRNKQLRQAMGAPTRIRGAVRQAPQGQGVNADADRSPSYLSGQIAALYAAGAGRQQFPANDGTEEDINRAAEKRAFLADRDPQTPGGNTLPSKREAPVSPYEIKAGTVIPAIMVGGISSDLPGQIIGQVRENVYDTATGRYVLIPQGAKLVGTYDNSVTTGQQRVLVAWTRIIYPDASSIDLGKMPGTDQGGLAGLKDQVNTHFWKAFGNALLLSVFSAGVQISQGGGNNSGNGLNAQQSIAAGLGQQLGQLGQELARRNARIQPTLEIRPGYQFTVMVTKDVVIRPWRK
jgi:type IV secretion system protein VirB10